MTIVWLKPFFIPFSILCFSLHFHVLIFSGFFQHSTNIIRLQIISNIQKQASNTDHLVSQHKKSSKDKKKRLEIERSVWGGRQSHELALVFECEIAAATLNGIDPSDLKWLNFTKNMI